MGMLYRRKKKDPATGEFVEVGPWWMKYFDNGKPIYQSTKKYDKREAIAALKRAEHKVLEGQREGPLVYRTKYEDLVEDLKRDYRLRGLKTWTRRQYNLDRLKPVFGGMRIAAITTQRLQEFVDKRLQEGAAPASINRDLDALKRMMVLGQRQTPPKVGKIPHFPRLTENNVREGFLEHDEFLAVRGAAPDYLKVAMTIAYYTGMRMREIISEKGLRWEQVELHETEGRIRLAARQTKTNQPRVIYMTGDFLRVIQKAKELRDRDYPHCPYVCHRNGKPFNNLVHGWQAACKRVGVENRTFHDLRRTGVRNLVRAGVPETVAMKISGHKTRSVFDRYNITSEEDLRQAAVKLGEYIQEKKVTFTVTPEALLHSVSGKVASQAIEKWRRGRDLNPRSSYPDTGFREQADELVGDGTDTQKNAQSRSQSGD
ncbi:MAG: site-specific integrase [Nitrospira sp. WS110]|nr:site-specific integrase [Nitrospira sp. WS110]